MKDFFDQFKENLENRAEPPFEKRLWQQMEKDLNRQASIKPLAARWWWAFAGVLVLLLSSNVFSLLQLRAVKKQISSIEQKTDTVYITDIQTKLLQQADTIFQTKTLYKETVKYINGTAFSFKPNQLFSSSPFSKNNKLTTALSSNYRKHFLENPFLKLNNSGEEINSNSQTNSDVVVHDKENTTGLYAISTLKNPLFKTIDFKTGELANDISFRKRRKTFQRYLYSLRPKQLQVGLSGGLAIIQNKNLSKKRAYSNGINAAIVFSPKVEMWVSAAYFKSFLETKKLDSGFISPSEMEPNDFIFDNAEADPRWMQYSVGIQYSFNSTKKCQPFIGLGFAVEKTRPFDIHYDFVNTIDGFEWSTKERIKFDFDSQYLLLRAGLRYKISEHWNAEIKMGFRKDFSDQNAFVPSFLNLAGGVNYRF